MEFETVIGLEVHAQLSTNTKIFCNCSTAFGSDPNKNTCPVCLGLPGALPVLNKSAVDKAILMGLALDCDIQHESIWDRKNYFYADLPKGYQITQFAKPICLGGHIDIQVGDQSKRINVTRIHMEEDAGKSIHDRGDANYSHVDLNRAGIPLCEIVSEPEMRSAEEAGAYLTNLRSIVRYTEACDGNMEEGSFRCDANVSIRPVGREKFGTKVEIKNLNSIKFVEKAINYEVERQRAMITSGKEISQETRLFNSDKGVTESMRSKEDAHDYRYFSDPDLVPLVIDQAWIDSCKKLLPELPKQKTARFIEQYQIPEYDAEVLTSDKNLSQYYEEAVKVHNNPKKISNWIMSELLRRLNEHDVNIEDCAIKPLHFAELIALIDDNTISGRIAKTVFEEMFKTGDAPEKIIQEKNLAQVTDTGAIEKTIDEIIAANPGQHEQYKAGKDKLFGFFVGQVMKATQGKANPQIVNDLLKKKL
jgi:aspartyl-tRNA(Asn)/glutamyl-tRNA(Gln) amidotransferase subunit B